MNDFIELTIDSMAQGGEGVGRVDGQVVFVGGALPGERVRVRLTERRPSYARGVIETILAASPERVAPRVASSDHAPWQHIAYPAQLRFKEQIVREQLMKIAGIDEPPVLPSIGSPQPWGYRNTAHLHVQNGTIGYYRAGSRDVVALDHDPLLLPELNAALAGLREIAADATLSGVTLRASAAFHYSVALLRGERDLEDLADIWLMRVPSLAGVAVAQLEASAERDEDEPDGEDEAAIDLPLTLHEELGGVIFELSPQSFFQVNVAQARRLLELARVGLDLHGADRLLDAFSGAGTFALPLAREVASVVAIEENPQAVADGERSALLNEIDNVRFMAIPVERALPELNERFAGVLLDPPRRGCHPATIAALLRLAPRRIVYISCHPGILARDLRPLLEGGYRLASVQPVDLFPQTPHIESVAVLEYGA
ncbi:23S rRNA (uracil(1939)-C(5))-methyltransferase RlmD [Candidatus Gracilibacteria bacterium]|nr:23S rRNA (uracil(1939)-C(5))-methyltransferase RlmD [Candidatus Gracilibacteria bacterium]